MDNLNDYRKWREQREAEKLVELRKTPIWMRRMRDGQLPPKDLTGRLGDAA